MKILLCIVIADFLTGLFHWVEDTYGVPSWGPFLNKQVVLPNIEHHRNPSAIGKMSSFVSRNYVSVTLFLAAFFIASYFGAGFYFFLTGLLASLGNEVHTWNHRKTSENNSLIKFLQDASIVQTRQQHNLHHKPPYSSYYCTLTNLTNAILERVKFWRGLEFLLDKAGIKVKRGSNERDGY